MAFSNLEACPPAGTDRTEAIERSGSPSSKPSTRGGKSCQCFQQPESHFHPCSHHSSGHARHAGSPARGKGSPRCYIRPDFYAKRNGTGEKWDVWNGLGRTPSIFLPVPSPKSPSSIPVNAGRHPSQLGRSNPGSPQHISPIPRERASG